MAKYKADVEAEQQSDPLAIPAPEPPEKNFHVWTSLLQRTVDTVEHFDPKEFGIMVNIILYSSSCNVGWHILKKKLLCSLFFYFSTFDSLMKYMR